MRINFILPTVELSGGVKVVFEYANRLQKRGHQVCVIYPKQNLGFTWPCREWYNPYRLAHGVLQTIRKYKSEAVSRGQLSWFNLEAKLLQVPALDQKYIPDADVVVATHWGTAYYVHSYPQSKGRKFYLIQHYEVLFGRKDKVEQTYKMGLNNIVISSWLKNIVERLGGKVAALIPDGIDFEVFYPEPASRLDDKVRILMAYRFEEWKGLKDGLKAYDIVKKKYPGIELVMFGPLPQRNELPKEVEFNIMPNRESLRKIYNSCDIFVSPSWSEGFGLPSLEAMACKRAVVATRTGAMFDFALDGLTALLSQPQDIRSLAGNILRLVEDKALRTKIAEGGYNHIKRLTWTKAVDEIEVIFRIGSVF